MSQELTLFSGAYAAFESWKLVDVEERKETLTSFADSLPENLRRVFRYQLSHADSVSLKTESLVSPTGETNDLYTQGRGVAVLLADSEHDNSLKAVTAMLAALFSAGNSVVVCSNNKWVTELVSELSKARLLPEGLLTLAVKESYTDLMAEDIRSFVYIGNDSAVAELNKALAARQMAITSLVAETDLERLPLSKDPKLVLRFVTERVRSINITAIGGNAMLLELGNENNKR